MQLAAWSENAGEVGAAIGSVLMARGAPPPPLELAGTPPRVRQTDPRDGDPQRHPRTRSPATGSATTCTRRSRERKHSPRRAPTSSTSAVRAPGLPASREEVSADVEMARVLPVIRALAGTAPRPDQHRHAQGGGGCGGPGRGCADRQRRLGAPRRSRHGRRDRGSSGNRGGRHAQPARDRVRRPARGRVPRACARAWRSPRRPVSLRPR